MIRIDGARLSTVRSAMTFIVPLIPCGESMRSMSRGFAAGVSSEGGSAGVGTLSPTGEPSDEPSDELIPCEESTPFATVLAVDSLSVV